MLKQPESHLSWTPEAEPGSLCGNGLDQEVQRLFVEAISSQETPKEWLPNFDHTKIRFMDLSPIN